MYLLTKIENRKKKTKKHKFIKYFVKVKLQTFQKGQNKKRVDLPTKPSFSFRTRSSFNSE